MKNLCMETQEQISLGEKLLPPLTAHFEQCEKCQTLYLDYQSIVAAFESQNDIEIPVNFADQVMTKIYEIENQSDWFEKLICNIEALSSKKIIEYGYLTAGFGIGILSFVRFVIFILIPVQ